jgi:glyoxylase-like metal-dependent hydrolase (beta-lactamase superfamily II)
MIQISEHIYRLFAGITANQYLIVEPDGISLVDTGLPGSHRLILYSLRQLGFIPGHLKYILLTHADPDHCGAAADLMRRTQARLLASELEAEGLRTGSLTRTLFSTTFEGRLFNLVLPLFPVNGAIVDQVVAEGQVLPVLGGLRVIASPGHTPGHISYYSEQVQVLFSGDSIDCRDRYRILPYLGDSTWDKIAAQQSFERQMALNPRIICGGHGCCRMQDD